MNHGQTNPNSQQRQPETQNCARFANVRTLTLRVNSEVRSTEFFSLTGRHRQWRGTFTIISVRPGASKVKLTNLWRPCHDMGKSGGSQHENSPNYDLNNFRFACWPVVFTDLYDGISQICRFSITKNTIKSKDQRSGTVYTYMHVQ